VAGALGSDLAFSGLYLAEAKRNHVVVGRVDQNVEVVQKEEPQRWRERRVHCTKSLRNLFVVSEQNEMHEMLPNVRNVNGRREKLVKGSSVKRATRLNEIKLNEIKLNEIKLNEIKLNEIKLNEIKLNEIKLNETRLNETRLNETRLNETRLNETRLNAKSKAR
jgi:uncharacterized protein YjbI with pentapeptide repeats